MREPAPADDLFSRGEDSQGEAQNSSRLALILTFSPWEKEQPLFSSSLGSARPANPAMGCLAGRPIIHPLLEERAGVRSSFANGHSDYK